ncbi:MAG: DUF4097 domain-containing protein [Eubacterium sp.]|nr:DUF4097 domain-containing protein [Eubacterium sp.]
MNRLMKAILYITAGCIGIGSAALILSAVLSGGQLVVDENGIFGRAKDVVHSAAEFAVGSKAIEVGEEAEMQMVDEGWNEEYNLLAMEAYAVQELAIDLKHGCLIIEESDDELIYVSASGEYGNIQAVCEDGRITVTDNRTGRKNRTDASVYLKLPEDTSLSDVDIRINAGTLEAMEGFYAKMLKVDTDAGYIVLGGITADTLAASVGAGEIQIDDSTFGKASLECGVGVMDIEADISFDTMIDCGMGVVNLELEEGAESVNYELSCGAGAIEIDGESYSGLARKRRIENGASATFTLNCGMGQICIE